MARDRLAAMRAAQAANGGQQQRAVYQQLDSYGDPPAPPSFPSQPISSSGHPSFVGYSLASGSSGGGGLPSNPRDVRQPPRDYNPAAALRPGPRNAPAPPPPPPQPAQDRWRGDDYESRGNYNDPYPPRDFVPDMPMQDQQPSYYNDPPPRPPPPAAKGLPRGPKVGREEFTDPFQAAREQQGGGGGRWGERPYEMREANSSKSLPQPVGTPYSSNDSPVPPPQPKKSKAVRSSQAPRAVSSTDEFFDGISSLQGLLRELNGLIDRMGETQRRALDDPRASDDVAALADAIRAASNDLKRQIQAYEADHSLLRQRGDPDGNVQVRMQQLAALKGRFIEAVQRYAEVEQNQRRAIRAKVERQLRVVKPDASDAEIRAAVEDEESGAGAQVFQQALANSQRTGAARTALREVQARGEDIKRIERTITELAQLFNDLALMVEEQDPMIVHIEEKAVEINKDVEGATTELQTAVKSARAARSKRKCCFFIILAILVTIGIIIAVLVITKQGPFANK